MTAMYELQFRWNQARFVSYMFLAKGTRGNTMCHNPSIIMIHLSIVRRMNARIKHAFYVCYQKVPQSPSFYPLIDWSTKQRAYLRCFLVNFHLTSTCASGISFETRMRRIGRRLYLIGNLRLIAPVPAHCYALTMLGKGNELASNNIFFNKKLTSSNHMYLFRSISINQLIIAWKYHVVWETPINQQV